MIKNLLTVGLLSTTLTGCFYQSVSGEYLQIAVEICGSFSQVHSVDSVWHGNVNVFCKEVGSGTDYNYVVVQDYIEIQYIKENTK